MLLRSSSSPILHSWLFPSASTLPDPQAAAPAESTPQVVSQLNRSRSATHLPTPPPSPVIVTVFLSSSTSACLPPSSPSSPSCNYLPQAGGHHDSSAAAAAARSKRKVKRRLPLMTRGSSEGDLSHPFSSSSTCQAAELEHKDVAGTADISSISLEEERESEAEDDRQKGEEVQQDEHLLSASARPPLESILTASGLDTPLQLPGEVSENTADAKNDDRACTTLALSGDGWCGNGGGRICGGGGGGGHSDRGDDVGREPSDGSGGHHGDSPDAYYQKMIEDDPSNSILLMNYAKYLSEVREDPTRAEEYCGRAILANPDDADALSHYADFVWRLHGDGQRAKRYFDRAIQAAPDNCHVLAAYARFLWDTEEEQQEQENRQLKEEGRTEVAPRVPFFPGTHPRLPPSSIAAGP